MKELRFGTQVVLDGIMTDCKVYAFQFEGDTNWHVIVTAKDEKLSGDISFDIKVLSAKSADVSVRNQHGCFKNFREDSPNVLAYEIRDRLLGWLAQQDREQDEDGSY